MPEDSEVFGENLHAFLEYFLGYRKAADKLLESNEILAHCAKKAFSDQKELERTLVALLLAVPRYLTEKELKR